MRAVVFSEFGDANVLKLDPQHPRPVRKAGEVLIKVFASSVNPIDFKTRKGEVPRFAVKLPQVCAASLVERWGRRRLPRCRRRRPPSPHTHTTTTTHTQHNTPITPCCDRELMKNNRSWAATSPASSRRPTRAARSSAARKYSPAPVNRSFGIRGVREECVRVRCGRRPRLCGGHNKGARAVSDVRTLL